MSCLRQRPLIVSTDLSYKCRMTCKCLAMHSVYVCLLCDFFQNRKSSNNKTNIKQCLTVCQKYIGYKYILWWTFFIIYWYMMNIIGTKGAHLVTYQGICLATAVFLCLAGSESRRQQGFSQCWHPLSSWYSKFPPMSLANWTATGYKVW